MLYSLSAKPSGPGGLPAWLACRGRGGELLQLLHLLSRQDGAQLRLDISLQRRDLLLLVGAEVQLRL